MAATDALPIPKKNTAYRLTVPILDADGDLVTGASTPDTEISKDAGTFADATNEVTEIATSSGMYYIDLTSTEMNADTVAVIVKTATSGAKTTPVVMYPQESGDIKVDLQSIAGSTVSTSSAQLGVNVVNYGGSAAQAASGRPQVDVELWNGTAVPAEHTAGYPIVTVKDGTGTGEIDTTSGGVLVSTLASQAKADVNAEVVDALATDTYAEVSGVVAATSSLKDKINWLFALSRNKITQTSTTQTLRNDADSASLATAAVSDDGTTATRAEWA